MGTTRPQAMQGPSTSQEGESTSTTRVALFATLVVLALVGVIAIIVFRPTITESKTETVVSSIRWNCSNKR